MEVDVAPHVQEEAVTGQVQLTGAAGLDVEEEGVAADVTVLGVRGVLIGLEMADDVVAGAGVDVGAAYVDMGVVVMACDSMCDACA